MRLAGRIEKWVEAGVIDRAAGARILAFEEKSGGFGFMHGMLGIGGFAILLGIAAVVSANWNVIPAFAKLGAHFLLLAVIAYALFRQLQSGGKKIAAEILLGLLGGLTLTYICLVGQVYQSQEPFWKVLVLWLCLITPMIWALAQTRFLIQLWVFAALATYATFLVPHIDNYTLLTRILCGALVPFVLIGVGQLSILRAARDKIMTQLSYSGHVLLAIGVVGSQFMWHVDFQMEKYRLLPGDLGLADIRMAFGICLLAALFLTALRDRKLLVPQPRAVDAFLVASAVAGFLPVIFAHPVMPVTGAAVEIAYLGLCGWAAACAGYPRAVNLATYLIALRLIMVYVEVFGSLLQTGVGLIISGILLILFVTGIKKLTPFIRAWAARRAA